MSDTKKEAFRRAVASNINIPLVEFFEERLQALLDQLIVVSVDKIERIQGRAQELQELIKLIKSVRE